MTGFVTATLNCDGRDEFGADDGQCPGWFSEDIPTVTGTRTLAKKYGWTRVGREDFCKYHSQLRARHAET